jgi:hypothetical protein
LQRLPPAPNEDTQIFASNIKNEGQDLPLFGQILPAANHHSAPNPHLIDEILKDLNTQQRDFLLLEPRLGFQLLNGDSWLCQLTPLFRERQARETNQCILGTQPQQATPAGFKNLDLSLLSRHAQFR